MAISTERFLGQFKEFLVGKPLDISTNAVQKPLAMAALLAWIGLGADGLSSFCYGPEHAFLALGSHTHLGLYLAIATAITIFVIAIGYNQLIELFPTGGGGYRITTKLIGPYSGLISGSALIIDYVLTIVISIVAATEAIFSLFSGIGINYKFYVEAIAILLLLAANLRGLRESILILLPIFVGFCLIHAGLLIYGFYEHAGWLPSLIPASLSETRNMTEQIGIMGVIAFFLRAYSLGAGTYTGLEAVPNNSQSLADPKVKTGKLTMFYMAGSLAFLAGGLIIVYSLWGAQPEAGQTLNAVVFRSIIDSMNFGASFSSTALVIVLVFEALILLVAANSGFAAGTSVLANMSADSWLPQQFSYLSHRLVARNNLFTLSLVSLVVLWITKANLALLVVLYSMNVFISFALSLLGLCRYWIKYREQEKRRWKQQLARAAIAFFFAMTILVSIIYAEFTNGGWITLLLTGMTALCCLMIKRHYQKRQKQVDTADEAYNHMPYGSSTVKVELDPTLPTAAVIVKLNRASGLFPLEWIQQKFPGYFRNFIFINSAVVDSSSYDGQQSLELVEQETVISLKYFENYCHSYNLASKTYSSFGTDMVEQLTELCVDVEKDFPNIMFFASSLSSDEESWFSRLLSDQLPFMVQRNLHHRGQQMIILPMQI